MSLKKPTRQMWRLLNRGLKLAKGKRPKDGTLLPLYSSKGPKFSYQVDFIHDKRCNPAKRVVVFAFRRRKGLRDMMANTYDFKLSWEV